MSRISAGAAVSAPAPMTTCSAHSSMAAMAPGVSRSFARHARLRRIVHGRAALLGRGPAPASTLRAATPAPPGAADSAALFDGAAQAPREPVDRARVQPTRPGLADAEVARHLVELLALEVVATDQRGLLRGELLERAANQRQ